ncbi:hypothetical protein TrLO_g6312 [Triparma laevis f. longispina]|uniref:Uncharacterized protein n=1 Tax=Triparma laevis f. longispina TaxID=1714387 RepID=A0A9W7KZR7_9STRA|nr:hypothetical protein TrLO_g6312 [Triparma laevis f. longispina]
MSKSVASESNEGHESHKTGGKRGAGNEGGGDEEGTIDLDPTANSKTLTTVSTVPATTDQFMFTNDFKRLLVGFVMWGYVDEAEVGDEGLEAHGGRVHRRGREELRDYCSRWQGYKCDRR